MGAGSQVPAGSPIRATVYSGRRLVHSRPDGVHYPVAICSSVVWPVHRAGRFHVGHPLGALALTIWE